VSEATPMSAEGTSPEALPDSLRRVLWALPRVAAFDEDAIPALRRDWTFATRALLALPVVLPFSLCTFAQSAAFAGGAAHPLATGAGFLLCLIVGSLSQAGIALSVVTGLRMLRGDDDEDEDEDDGSAARTADPRAALVGALTWWGLPSVMLNAAWVAWRPWLHLGETGATVGEVAVLVYPCAVASWLVARIAGVSLWVGAWIVALDLLWSASLWSAVFGTDAG
jgi:hypothetical protein